MMLILVLWLTQPLIMEREEIQPGMLQPIIFCGAKLILAAIVCSTILHQEMS